MWIGLFPELSEVGGIQQVSRHAAAVIAEKAREQKRDCRLFGLNDPEGPGRFQVGEKEYGFCGFGRNKDRLLFDLLRTLPRLEILYLGHVNLAPIGMLLRSIRGRMQYWVTVHGVEVWQPLPFVRRLALRRAARVLAVSEFTAQSAASAQGLHSARLCVVPPALDPSFLEPASRDDALPIPAGSPVLLTVGRLVSTEPGKGVDSVIRILPKLLQVSPELHYVVIGGGDLAGPLAKMVQASPARDRILLTGPLKGEELKQYYARADIFVMPSRQEGFGLVFLEAMASGKPVVGGDCGGAPEVIQDGVTGFLVDPDDACTLANRVAHLIEDETLRRRMGEAGRQRVEQCYTFAAFSERLGRLLESAVENRPPVPIPGQRQSSARTVDGQ
jgi:phosphatidyl-myo-inositol dimannoside synthase